MSKQLRAAQPPIAAQRETLGQRSSGFGSQRRWDYLRGGLVAIVPLLLLACGLDVSQRVGRALAQAIGSHSFGSIVVKQTIISAFGFFFLVLPLVTAEQLFPRSFQRPPPGSYLVGLLGWVLAWVLGYVVGLASQTAVAWLGLTPVLVVKVSAYGALVAVPLIFLNLFIFDFFYYWFHRMQHRIPWIWRIHAVHHSIRELNAIMSFHHPIEDLLRIIPITLPLAALVRFDDAPVIPLVSAFVGAMGQFIHTDTRLNFGPVRAFFGDGHYHRIHHSELDQHRDRNFAAFFPVWDRLFGTCCMPQSGEYPPVGLKRRPDGMTLRDYFIGIGPR
jgi:sterol desaturase/sphingolipid hydroxylase (fatty acid hydroxylase superfamily)